MIQFSQHSYKCYLRACIGFSNLQYYNRQCAVPHFLRPIIRQSLRIRIFRFTGVGTFAPHIPIPPITLLQFLPKTKQRRT